MDTDKVALPQTPPEEHRVKRGADRDIAFTGWLLGKGEHGAAGDYFNPELTRGTDVSVYLTTGARIVTAVRQWTRGKRERDSYRAGAHDTAAQAMGWLRADAGGELGPGSKEAWEKACAAWPGLQGEDVERVE